MGVRGLQAGDFKRIQWGPTFKLALARGASSGFIIAIGLIIIGIQDGTNTVGAALLFWGLWTVSSFIWAPAMQFMLKGMAAIFRAMGIGIAVSMVHLMTWMISLMVAIGDPIIFFINKSAPKLFEVEDFGFINLQPAIFVLADPASIQAGVHGQHA